MSNPGALPPEMQEDAALEPRPVFSRELGEMEQEVLAMASLAEAMVTRAVDALQHLDPALAHEVLEGDDEVDAIEISVETRCLRLLALHQPMASDLREIGSVIKIVTDIERIGDLAVDIAKIALKVERELGATDFVDVPYMANLARQLLRESVQCFIRKDASKLDDVYELEDRVDEQYRALRAQVFEHMIANPDHVVSSGWVLLAVHHVERIADHALNIAERVYFMVTGERAAGDKRQP